MALRIGGIRGFGVCCLLLAGCASTYLNNDSTSGFPNQTPAKRSTTASARPSEMKGDPRCEQPEWRHVIYRGRVDWDGIFEGPISGAEVSVFDGADPVFSTVTDSQGNFELPADLFGCPTSEGRDGSEWRPESYYAIVAKSPSGGNVKRELSKVDPQSFLHLEITPP
jgi:hypothetical protein